MRRRWELVRYDLRTHKVIVPESPEPRRRLFWTHRRAVAEAIRLNHGASRLSARWRFRVARRYR